MYFFVFIFIRLFAFNKQVVVGSHRPYCNLPVPYVLYTRTLFALDQVSDTIFIIY